MLDAQIKDPGVESTVHSVPRGALGFAPGGERFSTIPLVRHGSGGNLLLVSGVPADLAGPLDARLRRVVEGDHRSAARELADLDGAFAAVFWDAPARKLVVVTDFLGVQPLYERRSGAGLTMATDLKGLAASRDMSPAADPTAWGAFVAFGFVCEDLTFLRDARRVPPASITVYDAASGRTERSEYWRWPAPRPDLRLADVDTGALAELLRSNVRAYAQHHPRGGTVLLSGGFDSRLILCLLESAGMAPRAVVLSHPRQHDDADGRFARRTARALGVSPIFIHPPPGFFSTADYLDYLDASEVASPSLELFIPQLAAHIRPEMEAVWEGVAPGAILVPLHQPAGGFDAFLAQEAMLPGTRRWEAAARVFSPAMANAMAEGIHELIARARGRHADDAFGVSEFVVRNRTRNRTAPNPLKVYARHVLALTPGFTRAFWEVAAGIPFDVKRDFQLYLELFRRHFPDGLRAPIVSGGTLVKPRAGLDVAYYAALARSGLMGVPYMGGALRRLGLRPRLVRWGSSTLSRALDRVDPGHPDLDAGGVRALRRDEAGRDPVRSLARELLFYWQVWRWTMDGSLHARYRELLALPGPSRALAGVAPPGLAPKRVGPPGSA